MKKTPIFILNVKGIRIFSFVIAFLVVFLITFSLVNYPFEIKLSKSFTQSILSNSLAFSKGFNSASLFSYATFTPIPAESISYAKEPLEKTKGITTAHTPVSDEVIFTNNTHAVIEKNFLSENVPAFLKEKPEILIIHTHSTESYTPSESFNYTPTDTDRTTDKNFNMIAVGRVMEKELTESGFRVYHDESLNDYPSYNLSYTRSSKVASDYLKKYPNIKIILDVHRDAIVNKDGKKVKKLTKIDGKDAASIMFVVGSNAGGLSHPSWKDNLSFAYLIQNKANSLFPGLCRPINIRTQRFNQHLAPGAIIVEVGTNGNTLDEALLGAKSFSRALSSLLNDYS